MQIDRLPRNLTLAVLACMFTVLPARSNGADDAIQPGQWRTREEVLEMVNPMLSPELIAKRKSSPTTVEYCVRSSSVQELIVGKDKAGLCEGAINIAKGKISVQRVCSTGLGKGTRRIEGTYSPTRMETTRESVQETPQGPMHSKVRVSSERIGDCKQ